MDGWYGCFAWSIKHTRVNFINGTLLCFHFLRSNSFLLMLALSAATLQGKTLSPEISFHVDILNELSDRRRVKTFFTKEQSVLNGLQYGGGRSAAIVK